MEAYGRVILDEDIADDPAFHIDVYVYSDQLLCPLIIQSIRLLPCEYSSGACLPDCPLW